MERKALAQRSEPPGPLPAPVQPPPAFGSDWSSEGLSTEPASAPSSDDGATATDTPTTSSVDSAAGPPASDFEAGRATPSWVDLLRSAGLGSDRMRMGWIVALALAVTLAMAVCGGSVDEEIPKRDSGAQETATLGASADPSEAVVERGGGSTL
jgi:hypothetical protein